MAHGRQPRRVQLRVFGLTSGDRARRATGGGAAAASPAPLAVSTSSPFNRPSGYLVMRPPAGSAVALVDLPAAQRRRVDDVLVAAAHQHHRVDRRDRVEVVAQRQALLAQLAFVPVAVGDDDFAGLGRACTRAATAAATSASDRARDRSTPGPPPAPCRWLSIRPGITARPPRSTSRAPGRPAPASAPSCRRRRCDRRRWPPPPRSRWRRPRCGCGR